MCYRIRSLLLCAPVLLLPPPPVWATEAPAPSMVSPRPAAANTAGPSMEGLAAAIYEEVLLEAMGIGAAVGLTVGLINGHDEVEATLIGAVSSLVLGLALSAIIPPRSLGPAESRPAELLLLGEPVRGRPGQIVPRLLGRAALGLAAGAGAGGRGRGQLIVQYVVRW